MQDDLHLDFKRVRRSNASCPVNPIDDIHADRKRILDTRKRTANEMNAHEADRTMPTGEANSHDCFKSRRAACIGSFSRIVSNTDGKVDASDAVPHASLCCVNAQDAPT